MWLMLVVWFGWFGIVQEGALVEVLVLKGLVWYGFLHCGLFSFGAPAWRGPFGLQ